MNLFEWTRNHPDWHIVCPICKKQIDLCSPVSGVGLSKNKLKCTHQCSFEIDTNWIWYKIKASLLVEHLLMRVPNYTLKDAWEWVNIFKYNNPTYQISQEVERQSAEIELKHILDADTSWTHGNVLSVGCNSGQELFIFNNYSDIKSIVCVDISRTILECAVKKNHKALIAKHKSLAEPNKLFNIYYCESFVENLPSQLECYEAEEDGLSSKTISYNNKFDLVLVLKLFQSSYFDEFKLRRSLICLARQMCSGGLLIISFAKATEYISEDQEITLDSNGNIKNPKINFVSGVYQPKGFTDSFEHLNRLVREVLFIGEFKDVSVYYGNDKSFEYYISCKKI